MEEITKQTKTRIKTKPNKREEKGIFKKSNLKIIPLGGLLEIGKNITVIEYEDDIIIVDCGLGFPEDDMLGVDLVIPDITYLEKNKDKIRGLVITHGHEDHIGGIPYLLKQINVPIYATKLTAGLISNKLEEHNLLRSTRLKEVRPGQTITLGSMKVEFIRITHSIPDACALAIHTPVGTIVHTGDFKIDYTPIDGEIIDLGRLAALGNKGVLALMSDSTNAERKGYTMSESTVGDILDKLFVNCTKRIVVATFSSNVHRVQQIVNSAVKYKRKVAVCGRSMCNMIETARKFGYIKVPDNVVIDDLMSIGAEVIYNALQDIHVSGHACQEEQKLMLTLVKPKFFIPVHGEYRQLIAHAETAKLLGIPHENIFLTENGKVLELNENEAKFTGHVTSGKVLVDGLGVGDVGNIVLKDRQKLSQDGLIVVVITMDSRSGKIVSGPDVISRGFVYVRESENLMEEIKHLLREELSKCEEKHITDWATLKLVVREEL